MSASHAHTDRGTDMVAYNGHTEDCICVACMNADLSAHILATQGQEALDRINGDIASQHKDTSVRTRYAKPGQVCGRGVVRTVSERQVRYIKHLLATRNTSNLTRLPGSENIEKMSLTGARDLIERLLACPELPQVAQTVELATDAQKSYLSTLLEQREHSLTVDLETITKKAATKLIGDLKEAPRKLVEVKPLTKEDIKGIAGIYTLEGKTYRMKKARQGQHFYAEELVDIETGAWEYARGMAKKVPAEGTRLTLAEAEALSGLTGSCCCCGRTLEATVDGVGPKARFIGPICEAKYF